MRATVDREGVAGDLEHSQIVNGIAEDRIRDRQPNPRERCGFPSPVGT